MNDQTSLNDHNLAAILNLMESHVREIIRLQKLEDAVPDPPGFEQTGCDWLDTRMARAQEEVKALLDKPDEENDGSERKKESDHQFAQAYTSICSELDIKMPETPVDDFPYKTEEGREMERHSRGIDACAIDLRDFRYVSRDQRLQTFDRMIKIAEIITQEFPEADMRKDCEIKNWRIRYYWVVSAHNPFEHVPKLIFRTDSQRLLNYFFGNYYFRLVMSWYDLLFYLRDKWRGFITHFRTR